MPKCQPLDELVQQAFAGVLACSPELYELKLKSIAQAAGRTVDDAFRDEVKMVLETMQCELD